MKIPSVHPVIVVVMTMLVSVAPTFATVEWTPEQMAYALRFLRKRLSRFLSSDGSVPE